MAFARLGRSARTSRPKLARADSLTALIDDDKRRMLAELRLSAFASSRFFAMRRFAPDAR